MFLLYFPKQANSSKESQSNGTNEHGDDQVPPKKSTKKKKVSFNFGLETSEDAHIVKKEPISIHAPIIPIIKKECLPSAIRISRGESVIKPSRLTGLTQTFNVKTKQNGNNDEHSGADENGIHGKRCSDDGTDSDADDSRSNGHSFTKLCLSRDIDINKKAAELLKKNGASKKKSHRVEANGSDVKGRDKNGTYFC